LTFKVIIDVAIATTISAAANATVVAIIAATISSAAA
jgi:hypothetical protein